ncbi:MAG: hypothetical protein J6L64_07940 [Opitutales bacterium]|nr:hypothetical protein [Opitutales bacterium]
MDTNQEKQNEIMNAVGAKAPTLYRGDGCMPGLPVQAEARMAQLGEGVTDEKTKEACDIMLKHEFHAAAGRVWLGVICTAKKAALDARGNYANEADRGEGFEHWCSRVLGNVVTDRNLRRYMVLARTFLWDMEEALGEVPADEESLKKSLLVWCGERTLAQIDRDIRAEAAKRKELTASEHEDPKAPEEKPEPTPDARMAALLERFDRVLDRAQEYDTRVRTIFEESGADWSNKEAQTRLEALATHHAQLHEFYAGLFAKAKEMGERAG